MTSLLAALAVLGFALLPGLAFVPRWRRGARLESLGLVCAISLGGQWFALLLLNLAGLYDAATARLWLLASLLGTIAAYALRRRREGARGDERRAAPDAADPATLVVVPILLVLAARAWLVPLSAWDAVASWNRWARDYLLLPDYFASQRFFYPQYHAWTMSFPYVVAGDPHVDRFAYGLCFAYALVLYAAVARLSRALGAPGWLGFCLLFSTLPFTEWVGVGYADDAATAFAALSVALYLEALALPEGRHSAQRALLAGLAGGTAFLVKPSSLLATLSVPALCTLWSERAPLPARLRRGAIAALGLVLVAAPWLLSAHTAIDDPQLRHVVHGIHGGVSQQEIVAQGIERLIANATPLAHRRVDLAGLALAIVLIGAGMPRSRTALCCGLAALAGLAVWLNTANYDARALMPVVPLFAALAAAGLTALGTALLGAPAARAASMLVAAGCVALFLVAELVEPSVPQVADRFDRRQVEGWAKVVALDGWDQKRAAINPRLGALLDWQRDHPGFAHRLWSDSYLAAAVDPTRPDGGGGYLGNLIDASGRPMWEAGDAVLIEESWLGRAMDPRPKEAPPSVGQLPPGWQHWLNRLEHAGRVRRGGAYGFYVEYDVLDAP